MSAIVHRFRSLRIPSTRWSSPTRIWITPGTSRHSSETGSGGRIYASAGTASLSRIMLMDSAHLLEEEARHAAKHKWSRHEHPRPLYTTQDAERAVERFVIVPEGEETCVSGAIGVVLHPAGHILGAMSAYVDVDGRRLCFTGDLGRTDDPLMRPPHPFEGADVLVTESTYGDRAHSTVDPETSLGDIVRRTVRRNGVVLIPAFAVGRTETVLLHLSRLRDRGEIPMCRSTSTARWRSASPRCIDATLRNIGCPEKRSIGCMGSRRRSTASTTRNCSICAEGR